MNGALYSAWSGMRSRCYDPADPNFKYYGAKQVTMCAEWLSDFKAFESWALTHGWKSRPSGFKRNPLTLDRIKNWLGYSPENCRFTSAEVQSRNRDNSIGLSAFGEVKSFADWAADPRCVVAEATLRSRVYRFGFRPETAITEPPNPRGVQRTCVHPKTEENLTAGLTTKCRICKAEKKRRERANRRKRDIDGVPPLKAKSRRQNPRQG